MAPQGDKTVKLSLLTDVKTGDSRQRVQSLAKDYQALDKSADAFSKRVGRYFETGERAADDARRSVVEMQRALGKANDEWGDPRSVQVARARAGAFREELDEARHILDVQEQRVRVEEQINNAQRDRPAGAAAPDRFQSAGDVSTGLSAAAALLPGGAGNVVRGAADAAGLIEQLPRLSAGIAGMGFSIASVLAVAAPLALAIGAVAIVMDRAEKANRAYIATEEELARLRISGTSEDAQAQLLAAQEELAIAQARIQDIYARKFAQPVSLENFIATLGGSGGLDKALEDAEAQASDASTKINVLTQEIEKGTFAANDAAEAERLLREERTRTTIAEIEAASARRLEAERLKDEGTVEQVENRIAAIARERDAITGQIEDLESLVGTTEEGREAIKALEVELANLNAEERILKDEVIGVVAAREAEIAALEAQQDLLETAQENVRQLGEAQKAMSESLTDLEQQTAERREQIIEQSADRILEIEQKLADSIASAMRDAERADDAALRELNDEIAASSEEAAQNEIELREETARRIEDLEERAARERQRILNQYKNAEFDAIQNRDAVALDAAERARDEGLKENEEGLEDGIKQEKEALEQRLKEDRRANEQRIRDLRQSYEQEQRDRQIALNQKLQDLQYAAQQEIEITRQRQAEALSDLNAAYAQQKQAILGKYQEQFTIITGHYSKMNSLTATSLNALYQKWVDYYNNLAGAVLDAQSSSRPVVDPRHEEGEGGPGGYASGGRNVKGGWNWVGEQGRELMYVPRGSDIYSNRESMKMAGSKQITLEEGAIQIVTRSSDTRGIMREVRRQLPDMLADALEEVA